MPRKGSSSVGEVSIRSLIDRFTSEIAQAIATETEARVTALLRSLPEDTVTRLKNGKRPAGPTAGSSSFTDGRTGARLCPVPGCGQRGAGPRNRWFCKTHVARLSVQEQKNIVERSKRHAEEGKLPTPIPAERIVRLPPKKPRAGRMLEMTCRVEGCTNRSRGPRAGFICDLHRSQLSVDEQKAAREAWKVRARAVAAARAEPAPAAPTPIPTPVPPIVRKAEPAPVVAPAPAVESLA